MTVSRFLLIAVSFFWRSDNGSTSHVVNAFDMHESKRSHPKHIQSPTVCQLLFRHYHVAEPAQQIAPELICEVQSGDREAFQYTIEGVNEDVVVPEDTYLYTEHASFHEERMVVHDFELLYKRNTSGNRKAFGVKEVLLIYAVFNENVSRKISPSMMTCLAFGLSCENVPDSAYTDAKKWTGNNFRSQMLGCSGGQLDFVPACSVESSPCYGSNIVENGMISVRIEEDVTGWSDKKVKKLLTKGALEQLKTENLSISSFWRQFVYPKAVKMRGAAHNSGRYSAYSEVAYMNVGVIMHEAGGHGIGLGHSGTDKRCNMGGPDEYRCFNASKLWKTKWFTGRKGDEFHDATRTIDVLNGESFNGILVNINDYHDGKSTSDMMVLLEIPSPVIERAFYLMFDVKKGATKSNGYYYWKKGDIHFIEDAVEVVTAKPDCIYDEDYTRNCMSEVQGFAALGKKLTVTNFDHTGRELNIELCEKKHDVADTAHVMVYLDNKMGCPTSSLVAEKEQ